MTDRPQKEAQIRQPEPSDSDDYLEISVDQISAEIAPIAPLLKSSVEHMRKGNEHQRKTNCELRSLNANQRKQHQVTWLNNILILLLVGGLLFALLEQRKLRLSVEGVRGELDEVKHELITTNEKLTNVETDTKDTKEAVEKQPKISVKSDSATSTPMLVVEQSPPSLETSTPNKKSADPPPKPKGSDGGKFEFPIGPRGKSDRTSSTPQ